MTHGNGPNAAGEAMYNFWERRLCVTAAGTSCLCLARWLQPRQWCEMMREKLGDALKMAIKAKDQTRLRTIRLVLAAIKDRDLGISGAKGGGDAMHIADDDIAQLLATMVKQRRESMKNYEEAGRIELSEQEAREIAVISEFLPRQLDNGEMHAAIRLTIADIGATGIKDIGRTMAALRARYAGKMDFGKASALVKELL